MEWLVGMFLVDWSDINCMALLKLQAIGTGIQSAIAKMRGHAPQISSGG